VLFLAITPTTESIFDFYKQNNFIGKISSSKVEI